jgi:uncharacterized RDD family membrane protein YckC
VLTAATRDPTDVVGRRVAAYLIDGIVGLLMVALALAIGTYRFYERQPTDSASQAIATCDAFQQRADERFGPTPTPDPGPTFDRPSTPPLDTSARDVGDEACITMGSDIIWVDFSDLSAAALRFLILSNLLGLLNRYLLQAITGASVGKFALGLRVVNEQGQKAGAGWIVLRELFLYVDGIFFGIVGLISANTTEGHRRVGDLVASTYVVRKTDVGAPLQIPPKAGQAPGWGPTTPGWAAPPAHPDGPHWDAARGTWIRYDRPAAAWQMWDPATNGWRPIDT